MTVCSEFIDMDKSVTFDPQLEKLCFFVGAKQGLRRCFVNVIQNGLKYGKAVHVGLRVSDSDIHLIFTDQGPGIPEAEIDRVFQPFFRASTGRSMSSTGSGLGLAVVQEVVRYHQGQIRLENLPSHKGLSVEIMLPLPRISH